MKIKFLFLFTMLAVFAISLSAQNQDAPLTLVNIEKGLSTTKIPLAERNRLLLEGVSERGVTFALSREATEKLAKLGANQKLLEAIRAKSQTLPPLLQDKMPKNGNPVSFASKSGIEFLLIPKGEFMMGAKENELGSMMVEKPQRRVKLANDFYIGKYEITQKQWKAVMGVNPAQNKLCGEDCPVDSVSWEDVQKFIGKLNANNQDNFIYRLPTEAEWEYAARATTATRYYWGDDDEEKQWRIFAHSNDRLPTRAGSYLPNGFGLYDMSGNVWELVEDVWHTDLAKAKTDGSANLAGDAKERIMKGGSVSQYLDELRSARRGKISSDARMNNVGFRLVAVPKK